MLKKEARQGPRLPQKISEKAVVPWRDRCWISVSEAHQVAGEGRTRFYARLLRGDSRILTKTVGRRRLVNVASLREYCGE
jgi:hypothetical protein